jgi:hypothetical protein
MMLAELETDEDFQKMSDNEQVGHSLGLFVAGQEPISSKILP